MRADLLVSILLMVRTSYCPPLGEGARPRAATPCASVYVPRVHDLELMPPRRACAARCGRSGAAGSSPRQAPPDTAGALGSVAQLALPRRPCAWSWGASMGGGADRCTLSKPSSWPRSGTAARHARLGELGRSLGDGNRDDAALLLLVVKREVWGRTHPAAPKSPHLLTCSPTSCTQPHSC